MSSEVALGVDAVFIDGVDVVFRGLEGPQLRTQVAVAVLAAVGTSGAWRTHTTTHRFNTQMTRVLSRVEPSSPSSGVQKVVFDWPRPTKVKGEGVV